MLNQATITLIKFQIAKYSKFAFGIASFVFIIFMVFQLYFAFTRPEAVSRQKQIDTNTKQMRAELNRLIYTNESQMDENQKQVAGIYATVMCNMSGDLCEPNQKERYTEGTISSKIASALTIPLANPPASGAYWVKNSLENAGFIPKTYAQGMGFSSISSFQTIWKAMRDITFLILVIIIVAVGFIVMFNVPVGGKSSVTIEAMLPRLVVTMLLISFSYAIAGFMIDIMNVLMLLVVALFAPLVQGSQQDYLGAALGGGWPNMMYLVLWAPVANGDIWDTSRALYELVPSGIRYMVDSLVYYGLGHILLIVATAGLSSGASPPGTQFKEGVAGVGKFIKNTKSPFIWKMLSQITTLKESLTSVSKASGDTGAEVTGGWNFLFSTEGTMKIGGGLVLLMAQLLLIEPIMAVFRSYFTLALIFILLSFALIFVFFKLFMMLFGTYVDIILSIMFAPIYIVMNAMPGNTSFSDWFKQLTVNLLTFPIVMAILMVVGYITQFADTAEMWTPPFLSGIASQRSIQVLVAGTILFNIPSIVDKIREKFGYKKGFSMSPLSMISPYLALAGSVVGLAAGGNQLNTAFRKDGGLLGNFLKGTGVQAPPAKGS